MVVRMSTGKNIRGALSYNEQKVREGTAEILLASRFGGDVFEIGFSEKLARFEKLNQLNTRTKTNTLHLSLNFSPEDNLSEEKLRLIALDYMERIGFGNQPFLVYKHNDTNHPHLHILTTTVQNNGKAIFLHNLAKRKSEPARKAIESDYILVKAEGRKQSEHLGKSRDISNVVSRVVSLYKFSSMDELNGILRQFNIIADGGQPGSFLHEKGGLAFCQIDQYGYKIGKSIKASAIYKSPTLPVLNKKFEQNRVAKVFLKNKVQKTVLPVLSKSSTVSEFLQNLKSNDIGCSVQYDREGSISGVSFVDHKSRVIFSSIDLGVSIPDLLQKVNYSSNSQNRHSVPNDIPGAEVSSPQHISQFSYTIIKTLFESDHYQPDLSPEFLKKKRKKIKR